VGGAILVTMIVITAPYLSAHRVTEMKGRVFGLRSYRPEYVCRES